MATFDTSDDDAELDRIRGVLLGGGAARRDQAPQPPQSPPLARPADPEPTAVAAPPASQESEFAPAASFAAARPRRPDTAPPPAGAAPAPVRSEPAPVRAEPARPAAARPQPVQPDATPGDAVDVATAPPAPDPAAATAAPTPVAVGADTELGALLGGVDIDRLRQVLADHPDLLTAADTDTPEAAPADDENEQRRRSGRAQSDLATRGWRSWLVKLGIPMRKGAAERFAYALETAHTEIRCDLATPLVLGVTSYRGSCGKTSATVLLARLLAEIRGHDVLALDTDLHGSLLTRSVGEEHPSRSQGTTMPELAERLRTGADLRALVRDGGDGYAFVPGSHTFRANTVNPDGYRMIVAAARQVYPIVLVDMAQLSSAPLYQEVLGSLDALVMMSPTAEDGVGYLYRTQSELQHRSVDTLNAHRITALNNVSAIRSQVDTEEFARGLKHRDKRDVVEIPYDRHLAAAKAIDLTQLDPSTTAALTFGLAALFDTFPR